MKNRQTRRASRAGQALWMIISLLTLFIFVGTLAIAYFNMQYFQDEGMWPGDKTNFFMKRGDESIPVLPPPKKKTELPLPSANDRPGESGLLPGGSDTNGTEAVEEPNAVP